MVARLIARSRPPTRAAKQVKRQIEGEEAKGELRAPSKIPLPEFLQDFCQFLSTIRTAKSCLVQLVELHFFNSAIVVYTIIRVALCSAVNNHSYFRRSPP